MKPDGGFYGAVDRIPAAKVTSQITGLEGIGNERQQSYFGVPRKYAGKEE